MLRGPAGGKRYVGSRPAGNDAKSSNTYIARCCSLSTRELQPVSPHTSDVARLWAEEASHLTIALASVQDVLQIPSAVDARLQLGGVTVGARVDLASADGDLGRALGSTRVGDLARAPAELLESNLAVLHERTPAGGLTNGGSGIGCSASYE